MADDQLPELPENWAEIGKQIGLGFTEALARANIGDSVTAVTADTLSRVLSIAFKLIAPIGIGLAKAIADSEDQVTPELSKIAAAAASDVFGTNVPASAFAVRRGHASQNPVAEALGAGLMQTIAGQGSADAPSDEAAKRFLGIIVNMALEGWYQGWFFELMSSVIPYVDVGKVKTFSELDDKLANALGLGRLSRRVLGPIVDATCVTPLQWKVQQQYRQSLLPD